MKEKELLRKLKSHYKGDYVFLERAFEIAKKAHNGQKRESGEDYIIHPIEVANILCDINLDAAAIAAAFLHDIVEDSDYTLDNIKDEFGEEIAKLVDGVTKLSKIQVVSKEEEQSENMRKMFLAISNDIRVFLIKLADRLHNMRSLDYKSHDRQVAIARETLDIYAPLAGRLGISQIKCELEDLALKYIDPEMYNFFITTLEEKKHERQANIDKVIERIKEELKDSGMVFEVSGRPKHYYSIYKKMKIQGKSLEQIYDLIAVRVICESIKDCYSILGTIHSIWKPIPFRFKDYIAVPKANMYQSLHTTVVTEFGTPFEIQIRTYEMHQIAEYGIAAHWKYKEGKKSEQAIDLKIDELRKTIESQNDIKDSKEFIDALTTDLFHNEVLVFTPKGDVISLCNHANVIDFAYAVHSEVGNKCIGAKINGKMVPITTELVTGDVIEVVTSPTSKGPSLDWLKIAKSPSAKSKIRAYFKREMKDENIKLGKSMLEREIKKRGLNLSDVISDKIVADAFSRYTIATCDELYSVIGYGGLGSIKVANKLENHYRQEHEPEVETPIKKKVTKVHDSGVIIEGHDDLLIRFAKCCSPVPGDPIIAYISRGRGVCIHRADCPNMKNIEKDRIFNASWANSNDYFNSELKIKAHDEVGLVAYIIKLATNSQIQVTGINAVLEGSDNNITLQISVKNAEQIDELIAKLNAYKAIHDVFRVK